MKHLAHVTLSDGRCITVDVEAYDRREAAVVALRSTPNAARASARPVDTTTYVRDLIAEGMTGFPLLGRIVPEAA